MRGAYLIGIIVVLLIIGILVMKNMGTDNLSDATDTQSKAYMQKARKTVDDVTEKYKDTQKRVPVND